jgi:hypothetical protein
VLLELQLVTHTGGLTEVSQVWPVPQAGLQVGPLVHWPVLVSQVRLLEQSALLPHLVSQI